MLIGALYYFTLCDTPPSYKNFCGYQLALGGYRSGQPVAYVRH
jgi:hypothetical protein